MAGNAVTAAVLHLTEVGEERSLTHTALGDGEHLLFLVNNAYADDVIIVRKGNSAHAACGTSHTSYVVLVESYCKTVASSNNKALTSGCMTNKDKIIILIEADSDLSCTSLILELGEERSLDNALLGHHSEVLALGELLDGNYRGNLLAFLKLDDVNKVCTLGSSACLGDSVGLLCINSALAGEEHQVRVRVGDDNVLDVVVLLGSHTDDTLTASVLCRVDVCLLALDVAGMRYGDNAGVTLNKVLEVDLLNRLAELGATCVAVLLLDLLKLILEDLAYLALVVKDCTQLCNDNCELCDSILDLLTLESGELTECHLDDSLCLRLGETESLYKSELCRGNGRRRLDNLNYLVDIVDRDLVALEDVHLTKSLIKIEFGSVDYDFLLESDILVENLRQVHGLGLAAVDNKHIDRAGILKLGVLVELIEYVLGVRVASVLNDDSHTASARLVTKCSQTLDLLLTVEICDTRNEHRLVYHIGDLGEDDLMLFLVYLGSCSDVDSAAAGLICLTDTARAVDDSGGGEVGSFDKLHKLVNRALGIVNSVDRTVNNLGEVMRRNVGRHTNRDTDRSVYEKVRES